MYKTKGTDFNIELGTTLLLLGERKLNHKILVSWAQPVSLKKNKNRSSAWYETQTARWGRREKRREEKDQGKPCVFENK